MEPGRLSPAELMADIQDGFYVTSLMGMGINGVTGDYSRGASGFRIEKGELTTPISEATVAGNLKDMFLNLTPADDLVFKYGANAPTLRIDGMTRSEEHTSELQSLMRNSYAVFCLKKKKKPQLTLRL